MAKNQKRAAIEFRWQRLGIVIFLVIGIASLTVGYVLQRRAHDELGQQIKAVEKDIEWFSECVQRESERVERNRRKDALVLRASQFGLGLTDVVSSQRVTVPLVPPTSSPALGTLAGRSSTNNQPAVGPLAAAGGVPLVPHR